MLEVGVREMHERLYTLDSYPFKERHLLQFEWVRRWAENPNCDLLIWGLGGEGKTGLALAVARERMLAGDRILFQRLYQVKKVDVPDFYNRARHASLLVLDDFNLNMIGWLETLALNLLDLKTRVIITMSPVPEQTVMSKRVIDRLSSFVRIHLRDAAAGAASIP